MTNLRNENRFGPRWLWVLDILIFIWVAAIVAIRVLAPDFRTPMLAMLLLAWLAYPLALGVMWDKPSFPADVRWGAKVIPILIFVLFIFMSIVRIIRPEPSMHVVLLLALITSGMYLPFSLGRAIARRRASRTPQERQSE